MSASPRTRVVHVLTRPELGGAQANTLWTVRHLDRQRFAPALITSPDGPLAEEMAAVPDAEVIFLPELVRQLAPARDSRAARALVRHFRRLAPHVVHTHSSKAGILGRWAAWRAGVPVVVHTVHGFPFHPGQPAPLQALYVELERAAARVTTHFICVSSADGAKGVAHGVFSPSRTSLIRSGIPLAPYRAAAGTGRQVRRELEIPPEAPLVGMVACFKAQKDPLTFVRAAARVAAARPDAWFLMVGDGTLRPDIEEARRSAGLQDRLLLAGWRRDMPAVMDALDVSVLTSVHEGLPRVVPEAMAAARPVVATAVDGTPEAVTHGVTGLLVAPRRPDAVAEAILELLADGRKAAAMGVAGQERVAPFDIDVMVRQQEDLYTTLLERQGSQVRG